jgi:putative transposase
MRIRKTWQNYSRNKKLGLKKGYPRIKQLHRYNSFTYPFGDKGWWIENNRLILPQNREKGKLGSEKLTIKITLHQEIKGTVQNLSIKKKNGKWYVLFVSEVERKERIPTDKYIGIDLNCKENSFCVLSDGTKIKHPKHHKKAEERLIKTQKLLSRKQLKSKNRNKTRLLYSKQWEKVNNQQRDSFFKMVKEFEEYDGIARENLIIPNMMKNRRLAKVIFRASWGNFNGILGDRAEEAGRQLVKVSPYNTTQRCSNCNELAKEKVELNQRVFKCWNCSMELDRDINSARNVLDKAIEQNKFNIGAGFALCREATGVALLKQEICV